MSYRVLFSNLRRPAFGHGLSPEIRVVHNVHQRLLLDSVSEPSLVLPVLVVLLALLTGMLASVNNNWCNLLFPNGTVSSVTLFTLIFFTLILIDY